jgi:hypothetical protein
MGTAPLGSEGRGSSNLIRLFNEDEFLTHFKGTFAKFVEDFYPVIMREKEYERENT